MTYLPVDILYMVCTQLWHQRDSNTLYNCACSGKLLATIAVTLLYRYQTCHVARWGQDTWLMEFSTQDIAPRDESDSFLKRAGLWRTIILSSIGKTLYPYSQYIWTLNLQHLEVVVQSGPPE